MDEVYTTFSLNSRWRLLLPLCVIRYDDNEVDKYDCCGEGDRFIDDSESDED